MTNQQNQNQNQNQNKDERKSKGQMADRKNSGKGINFERGQANAQTLADRSKNEQADEDSRNFNGREQTDDDRDASENDEMSSSDDVNFSSDETENDDEDTAESGVRSKRKTEKTKNQGASNEATGGRH